MKKNRMEIKKLNKNWKNKTLESLEKNIWPELSELDKQDWLMVECNALRKKPIKNFSIENLREMIGQDIGLDFLIPLAIDNLKNDITIKGECYIGDLLDNVLKSETEYWEGNKDNWRIICDLFEQNKSKLQEIKVSSDIRKEWFDSYDEFKKIN